MGLLYLFPVSKDEQNYVIIDDKKITVKSYGLPLIFWGYTLGILSILFFMFIAIKGPLFKLLEYQDGFNYFIFISVLSLFIFTPIVLISFFFYEKVFIRESLNFTIVHKLFGLPVYRRKFILNNDPSFIIKHFLDSPNMARLQNHQGSTGFQNKGYFELKIINQDKKEITIDRCSKKIDLERLIDLFNTKN